MAGKAGKQVKKLQELARRQRRVLAVAVIGITAVVAVGAAVYANTVQPDKPGGKETVKTATKLYPLPVIHELFLDLPAGWIAAAPKLTDESGDGKEDSFTVSLSRGDWELKVAGTRKGQVDLPGACEAGASAVDCVAAAVVSSRNIGDNGCVVEVRAKYSDGRERFVAKWDPQRTQLEKLTDAKCAESDLGQRKAADLPVSMFTTDEGDEEVDIPSELGAVLTYKHDAFLTSKQRTSPEYAEAYALLASLHEE